MVTDAMTRPRYGGRESQPGIIAWNAAGKVWATVLEMTDASMGGSPLAARCRPGASRLAGESVSH